MVSESIGQLPSPKTPGRRRLLHVPSPMARARQRRIYDAIKQLFPVSWRPDLIEQKIRDTLMAKPETFVLRSDLENCFETLPQDRIIQRIAALPVAEAVRAELLNVVRTVPRGLPVGSPLSSWLGEFVLRDIDAAMARYPDYFRYVDDICVLGTEAHCVEARGELEAIAGSLGMQLSKTKTAILPGNRLTFLGRSFQVLADADILTADLSGAAFQLPNGKTLALRVRKDGVPYQERPGEIRYSLSCVLNRMSQQPTPYLLEMLMLRPAVRTKRSNNSSSIRIGFWTSDCPTRCTERSFGITYAT